MGKSNGLASQEYDSQDREGEGETVGAMHEREARKVKWPACVCKSIET